MLKRLRTFLKSVPSRLYGSRIDLQAEGATYLHSSAKVVPMANWEILEGRIRQARERLPSRPEVQRKRLVEDQEVSFVKPSPVPEDQY
jgi:hypothetical protein